MRTTRIYEQADRSATAPCGAIYSWIVDGLPRRCPSTSILRETGWKWIAGWPGCFVTNDPDLAARTANDMGIDIITNGTHAVLGVPALLCDPATVS